MLDKSYLRITFHLGSQCVLHEGTVGVNAGNISLFSENTLPKCKFVLSIRKSEELKHSSIVLSESNEIDRGYHLVCYERFIGLSQQQQENIGEQWERGSQNKTVLARLRITSSKSHSNAGIYPKMCLFCSKKNEETKKSKRERTKTYKKLSKS